MTKLAYEKPMMSAELYQTNAYCNTCGQYISNGHMLIANSSEKDKIPNFTTLMDGVVISDSLNKNDTIWGDDLKQGTVTSLFDLSHIFTNLGALGLQDGNCRGSGQNRHSDDEQMVWQCSCGDEAAEQYGEAFGAHGTDVYYLEFSHNRTYHDNSNNPNQYETYFLYKETYNDGGSVFDMYDGGDPYPSYDTSNGQMRSDTCVGRVSYVNGKSMVANS